MKKLMLFVFVLSVFSNVFSMDGKKEYKKDMVSVVANFSYIKKDITVYYNVHKFKQLLWEDLDLSDCHLLKKVSIRKRTIKSLFSKVTLNLSGSYKKSSCYIPSTKLGEVYKEGYKLEINFVKTDKGKYKLVIDAVKKNYNVFDSPYVKIKMFVVPMRAPNTDKEVSAFIYPEDYKKLREDSRYKDWPEATLRDVDKRTIDTFYVNLKMKLNDSKDVIRARMSLEDAVLFQPDRIKRQVEFVMNMNGKKE